MDMAAERDADHRIFLTLLGAFRAWCGAVDLCPRGRKARALLAYLAVAPDRSATREALADLLWTDRGSEQARGSLRHALTEIRGRIAHGITTGWEAVSLDPDTFHSDIDAVLDCARHRDAAGLAARLEPVRGAFLEDLEGLSPGFDDWLLGERVRQHAGLLSATLDAVAQMVTGSARKDIQSILRSLDRLDPLNEAVARAGLRADHATGDMASLHRRFRGLEEGLLREFGARPSEETRALFVHLTALAPNAGEPPLPTAATPSPDAAATPVAITVPMIFVAPFATPDSDPELGEIAEIATDDLRTALAGLRDLRVVMLDPVEIDRVAEVCAGALGVYMLSGRLRRLGGAMRINFQLGNAETNIIIWSTQIAIEDDNLSQVVDQIVERAAGAVLPAIDRDLVIHLPRPRAGPQDSVTLYARARMEIRQAKTLDAARAGAALLERIVADDPGHLGARLMLARMYNTDFWQQIAGHDVADLRERADALVAQAVTIEPGNMAIKVRRAWCHIRNHAWRLAERDLEAAVTAMPYDADLINECAFGYCHLGALDIAEPLMQRAFRLNPFPPSDYHADYAVLLTLRADAPAAEEHFAVSGEQGMQYLAVRLANLARLGDAAAQVELLRAAFARSFHTAWQAAQPPLLDDVGQWMDYTMPFRRPEDSALIRDGLLSALAPAFPTRAADRSQ